MKKKFSVLMSVYLNDNVDYFILALESVIKQTLSPSEVIIVQDGPISERLHLAIQKYCESYQFITTLVLPCNVGLGRALNEGLKMCTFELVARMDSDDISLPNRFESQVLFLMNNPEIDIVGGQINEFEVDSNIILTSRIVPQTFNEIRNFAKVRNPLNHVTVMFKKSVINKIGGYQDFYQFEDYFLWIRAINAGCKIANLDMTLVNVRFSSISMSRRSGSKYAKSEYLFQKYLLSQGVINHLEFFIIASCKYLTRMLPKALLCHFYKYALR